MSDIQDPYAMQVVDEYKSVLLSNYSIVIAATLVIYDFSLTLSREIQCIWKRSFCSSATMIFLLSRYLTVAYAILVIAVFPVGDSLPRLAEQEICTYVMNAMRALFIMLYLLVTAFTTLRVYAIWSKDPRVLVVTLLLGSIAPVIYIYCYATEQYVLAPPPFSSCEVHDDVSTVAYNIPNIVGSVVFICSEGAVLALTWVKTLQIRRFLSTKQSGSRISLLIQRDGSLQFSTILMLILIHVVAYKYKEVKLIEIILEALIMVLVARFILDLRQVYVIEREDSRSTHHKSPLRFTVWTSECSSPSEFPRTRHVDIIVGNLGASVNPIFNDCDKDEVEGAPLFSTDPLLSSLLEDSREPFESIPCSGLDAPQ